MLCIFGYSTKLPRGRSLNKIRSLFSRIFLLFLDFINFYGFIDFHRSSWILWIFRDFLDFPDFLDFHGFFFIFEDFLILKSGNLSALPLVNYLRLRFYFCINRAIGKYAVVRKTNIMRFIQIIFNFRRLLLYYKASYILILLHLPHSFIYEELTHKMYYNLSM